VYKPKTLGDVGKDMALSRYLAADGLVNAKKLTENQLSPPHGAKTHKSSAVV